MKNIGLSGLFCVMALAGFSQPKPAVKKTTAPVKATTAPAPAMKNALDSFSYAIGLSIANFYKEQGVQDVNSNLVIKAINDATKGSPMLNEAQLNECIVNYMQVVRREKASGNIRAGEKFLAENKAREGVVELPSGLQYQVIQQGTGAKPGPQDKVKVHYQGSLLDGTIFDSSIQRGEPLVLGVNGVIPGWTEALQLMPEGSKWKLFIPSSLAYGDVDAGPSIKAGSTLIFEVELIEVMK